MILGWMMLANESLGAEACACAREVELDLGGYWSWAIEMDES